MYTRRWIGATSLFVIMLYGVQLSQAAGWRNVSQAAGWRNDGQAAGWRNDGQAAGWRNDGSGHFPACQPPVQWTASDARWKTELPGQSLSSPIISGDFIFTTAEPSELICLSAADGNILWKRSHNYSEFLPAEQVQEISRQHELGKKVQEEIAELQKELKAAQDRQAAVEVTKAIESQIAGLSDRYDELTPYPPPATDSTGNTTSTPVSDGKLVWTVFANGIASCHDLHGNRRWMAFIEKPGPRHASSPVLVDGLLVLHLKNLIAIDSVSGKVRWTVQTPARMGTPAVVQVGDDHLTVTAAGSVIRTRDGRQFAEKLFDLPYCSPVAQDDVVYAVERGTIKAIRLSSDGASINAETLWETRGAEGDQLASPIIHDGLVYTVTGNGILEVLEAESGKRAYRKRLDLGQGRVDSSLALAGDVLYVNSTSGQYLALRPGREFQQISKNAVDGTSSSPFFQQRQIVIRTPKHLVCIARP